MDIFDQVHGFIASEDITLWRIVTKNDFNWHFYKEIDYL